MRFIYAVLAHQNDALETKMGTDFKADEFPERLKKINLVNALINLGNTTHLAFIESQALRDYKRIEDAQQNFDLIEKTFQEILSLTRVEEHIKRIEEARAAIQTYEITTVAWEGWGFMM